MKCDKCLVEYPEKDFYGKTTCYRCIYKEKTSKKIIFLKIKTKKCAYCENEFTSTSRSKYCSEKCLKIKTDLNRKNIWTRKIEFQRSQKRFGNFNFI